MEKPSTVVYREFVDKIQEAVNTSNLPAFVIIPVIKDTLDQLVRLEERQYQHDAAEWNKARAEKSKSEVNADGGQENQ